MNSFKWSLPFSSRCAWIHLIFHGPRNYTHQKTISSRNTRAYDQGLLATCLSLDFLALRTCSGLMGVRRAMNISTICQNVQILWSKTKPPCNFAFNSSLALPKINEDNEWVIFLPYVRMTSPIVVIITYNRNHKNLPVFGWLLLMTPRFFLLRPEFVFDNPLPKNVQKKKTGGFKNSPTNPFFPNNPQPYMLCNIRLTGR